MEKSQQRRNLVATSKWGNPISQVCGWTDVVATSEWEKSQQRGVWMDGYSSRLRVGEIPSAERVVGCTAMIRSIEYFLFKNAIHRIRDGRKYALNVRDMESQSIAIYWAIKCCSRKD